MGIGAQRAGTTWFCDLLLQHPGFALGVEGRKELHELYRPDVDLAAYRQLFTGCAGEWTPYYLRAPWVPALAARVLRPAAPVLVLLRDPVERFASAMRHQAGRADRDMPGVDPRVRVRFTWSDAIWAGMYADQLDCWEQVVGADRMVVLQYERVLEDPQAHADLVWRRVGLDPIPLVRVDRPSRTSSQTTWEWPEQMRATLAQLYRPQVGRLCRWGIDPARWPSTYGHGDGEPVEAGKQP